MDYLAAVPALAGSLKTCFKGPNRPPYTKGSCRQRLIESPAAIPGQRRTLADIVDQIKKAASIAALGLDQSAIEGLLNAGLGDVEILVVSLDADELSASICAGYACGAAAHAVV